jgi:hypothetical protein
MNKSLYLFGFQGSLFQNFYRPHSSQLSMLAHPNLTESTYKDVDY